MLIGERIRVARKRLGKTQAELAIDIESHVNSVGRWESGERNPTIDDLDRLAVALHVPLGWLVSGDESGGFPATDRPIYIPGTTREKLIGVILTNLARNESLTDEDLGRISRAVHLAVPEIRDEQVREKDPISGQVPAYRS